MGVAGGSILFIGCSGKISHDAKAVDAPIMAHSNHQTYYQITSNAVTIGPATAHFIDNSCIYKLKLSERERDHILFFWRQ